eukprot:3424274-Pyramimonas_sp.AAC.1
MHTMDLLSTHLGVKHAYILLVGVRALDRWRGRIGHGCPAVHPDVLSVAIPACLLAVEIAEACTTTTSRNPS